MLDMSKKDKMEIEKLKEVREWIKMYRTLSEEEKEQLLYERWEDKDSKDNSNK